MKYPGRAAAQGKRCPEPASPGADPSVVNDDFGDVYGVYLAITGEGYTYKEIYEFAKFLQRELLNAEVYRERDELLPIIARAPEAERVDLANLEGIQLWSPAAQKMIPVAQVVTGFKTEFEDPYIWRRNRTKMIKIHVDP
ncbi:MAG: efflux RND transporter permease subunit [Deltaproteobacteria bacterium]|nr:efflux RND transporter permease subunit [Deltaproteobacteria bacterium]MBW2152097.1 efflux RND transporter permease subunit [Deltaproteobacteria bacterium]